MAQMTVTHLQAQTLIEVLQDTIDGEDILLTKQGDGTLLVAGSVTTVEINESGGTQEL